MKAAYYRPLFLIQLKPPTVAQDKSLRNKLRILPKSFQRSALDFFIKKNKSPIPLAMKTLIPLLATIPLVVLTSCSSVQETAAMLKDQATSIGEPKLRLTKADPTRFLPAGTSAEKLAAKGVSPARTTKEPTRLLAKNTLPKKQASRAVSASKKTTKTSQKKVVVEEPYIELPPLPASSANDNKGFRGILPSLDGSDEATFIDVDGKPLELPPMEFPDPEEESGSEASA